MQTLKFYNPEMPGLVSVIIPTKNGERFIGAALESIGRQTYTNWEVIIIEDGSKGLTETIVRRFASLHPNNHVHYQRSPVSQGAAFTRNAAFTLASGEWIAFLDCDDRWLPDHLDACVHKLNETGEDIAYSAAIMCEDGTDHVLSAWGPTHGEIVDFPQSLFGRSFVTPSATVVRRDVIGDVGNWNTNCRYCEDAEFFLRAAQIGKKFRYIGGVHCLYRKNHEGATTQGISGTIEEYATISKWFIGIPNTQKKRSRKMVAVSFSVAAKMHARNNQTADPSATRSRAAGLYFKAWRLHPRRIRYLFYGCFFAMKFGYTVNDKLPKKQDSPAPEFSAPEVPIAQERSMAA